MKLILFNALVIFHVLVWLFVLSSGFICDKFAKINIYIFIPLIYLLHLLPFHILDKCKSEMYKSNKKNKEQDIIFKRLVVPNLFFKLRDKFSNSFRNPLSIQGMLIFGLITSIYRICPPEFIKKIKI